MFTVEELQKIMKNSLRSPRERAKLPKWMQEMLPGDIPELDDKNASLIGALIAHFSICIFQEDIRRQWAEHEKKREDKKDEQP